MDKELLQENPQEEVEENLPEPEPEEPEVSVEPEAEPEPSEPEPDFSLTDDGEVVIREEKKAPEGPVPYTSEEIKAIGIEKLDPKRIPPELLPFYKSMQADYTRKTQALREREKELEARTTPQVKEEPTAPEQPQMTEQQARDLFFEAAKERAAQMLGLQVGDFDEYDAKHMSYLSIATQELYSQAQHEMARRNALEEKKRKYNEFLIQLRAEEPHYAEINQWSVAYLESLPYKEYSEYMRIFNGGTVEEIGGAIQKIRKAWYRKNETSRPKETPPMVEQGSSSVEEPPKKLSTAAFARMSDEEKADFLRTNGYAE